MLVLLGAPGAGKGTQAALLAADLGLVHLSTGDLFRDHLRRRTSLGLEAESAMAKGELVTDATVIAMVRERLSEGDARGGVVFDGFPRTVPQAHALDGLLSDEGYAPVRAFELSVRHDTLVRRLTGRRVCPQGHTYHLDFRPPREPGVCDVDGSALYQRLDDTPETVERRMVVYEAETAPVTDYYAQRSRLVSVSGEGDTAEVAQRLRQAVDAPVP